jgi:hypothetical protein
MKSGKAVWRKLSRRGVHSVRKPVYSGLFVGGMDEAAFSRTVESALEGGARE